MPFSDQAMSLPEDFLFKIKELKNFTKTTISIDPSSGQTSYGAGSKISFTLPYASLLSMNDLALVVDGETTNLPVHAGDITNGVFFPRNMSSMIEEIEIKVNGQIVQSIPRYNDVYNVHDNLKVKKNTHNILDNSKPNLKVKYNPTTNVLQKIEDFKAPDDASLSDATNKDNYLKDKDTYVITNWYGLMGSADEKEVSANFIDTNLLGEVIISFRLAGNNVLMYGDNIATGTVSVADRTTAQANANTSFKFENVRLSAIRYNMPDTYYNAISSNLSSGSKYRVAFNHYSIYSSSAGQGKGSVRFNENSRDIKYMMSFYTDSTRNNSAKPKNVVKTNGFNQSPYFQYDGRFHNRSQYQIGSTLLPVNQMTTHDTFLDTTRLLGKKGDLSYEMHDQIEGIDEWSYYYFASPLSLEFSQDDDSVKLLSGLSSENLPISVSYNYEHRAIGGGYTFTQDANVLVCTTRMIEIGNNQSVALVI